MTRILKLMGMTFLTITFASFDLFGEGEMDMTNDDSYVTNNEMDFEFFQNPSDEDVLGEMEMSDMNNDGNV